MESRDRSSLSEDLGAKKNFFIYDGGHAFLFLFGYLMQSTNANSGFCLIVVFM